MLSGVQYKVILLCVETTLQVLSRYFHITVKLILSLNSWRGSWASVVGRARVATRPTPWKTIFPLYELIMLFSLCGSTPYFVLK